MRPVGGRCLLGEWVAVDYKASGWLLIVRPVGGC